MRNSKHWLRAFGLSIMAALGMMAFAAATAQALSPWLHGKPHAHELALNPNPLASPSTNTPGSFLINLGSALLATATGKQVGVGFLLVPGARDLKLECTTAHITEGKINSSTDASGKILFLGCLSYVLSTGEHLANCEIPGKEILAEVLILPFLHGGETFLLFEPAPGKANFTTVLYKKEMGCVLPHSNPVGGAVTALVHNLDAVVQLILFSPGIQLLTGDKLNFGVFPSYIDAEAELELTQAHAGQKLGAH